MDEEGDEANTEFIALRSEIDYLQSLANYLMIQIVSKGKIPELDPKIRFDNQTLQSAIDTINNYINQKPEHDEMAPPDKLIT